MVLAMLTSVVQSGGLTASPAQIPFYHPILLTYRFAFVELLKDSWDVFTAFSSASSTDEIHPETHVLCLGLGSPIASQNARVQLAFLAETCTLLNVVCRLRYPLSVCGGPPIIIHLPFFHFAFSQVFSRVSVYDPVFTEDDRELIEEMQMTVLSEQSARLLLSVVRG